MKKLVLLLAVVFGVSMISCGGSEATAEAADTVAAEATEVVEEAPCCDTCGVACDSCAAEAEAPVEAPAAE
ncbi:MAG: hypothetical protein ACI31C_06405 [Muribaculaceae bacterium]